jgi:predicted transcriptional regulator
MARVKKVMISLPEDLLARIDRAAAARDTSRSAFLQEAARRELGWPDPAAIDAAVGRARAALAGIGSFESADLIRSSRDSLEARDRRR